MTPAALADALLTPGHPLAVGKTLLPEGMAPPLPPGSPVELQIRLTFPTTLDVPSHFCIKRSVDIATLRPGAAGRETIEPRTDYRFAGHDAHACDDPQAPFFSPAPGDRPRAFEVVRLVLAAVRDATRKQPAFPVSVDDSLDREMSRWLVTHPEQRRLGVTYAEITDGRAALASLRADAIRYVGRNLYDSSLIAPDVLRELDRSGAQPNERWALLVGGTWTMDVVLDGDRILAMALRDRIPPPF